MNPTSSHRILLSYIFHLQSTSRLTMSSTSMNRQQTGRCLWHSSPCKSVRIAREQLHPNTSGWQFEAMQNRHLIHGIHGQAVHLWRLCSKMNRTWYWISINIGRWSSPNDWSYDRSLELELCQNIDKWTAFVPWGHSLVLYSSTLYSLNMMVRW